MDENFGLTYHLSYATKNFLEIPPEHVTFITEFVILSTNPKFYEVNQLI